MSLKDAATAMGLGLRQAKRIKKRFAEGGAAALVHRARGRACSKKLKPGLVQRVLDLSHTKYPDFNDAHFTLMLQQQEGIKISRDTVRRIRRAAGIKPKKKRRPPRHHGRRPRRENQGAMILWDGSHHRWFGPDRPFACLMAAIDDATSAVLALRFEPSESSIAYLRLLNDIIGQHGIPISIYHDRHSALHRNDNFWTIEEQINGRQDPTQIGSICEELGIKAIPAYSPQAKGRVERLFGTLQDRMVAEMRLAKITAPEMANPWLRQTFIPKFNQQFALPPAKTCSLFRKTGNLDLEQILSFRYNTTVANDNTVKLNHIIITIPPGPGGRGYAKAKVVVRQALNGTWRVFYQNKIIAVQKSNVIFSPEFSHKKQTLNAPAAANLQWQPAAQVTS
jgi:transposase